MILLPSQLFGAPTEEPLLGPQNFIVMAFSYPEFHGVEGEDVVQFLENLEVSCISSHIIDQAQVLCLLQICLKGDARAWFKDLEAQNTESKHSTTLTFANVSKALVKEFQHVEDADKVWHAIQVLEQKETESVEDFLKKFNKLWEDLCKALDLEHPLK